MKLSRALPRTAAAVAACAFAASAHAVLPPVGTVCAVTDITPNAEDCRGFYSGNLLNNSPADVAVQTEALLELGLVWDGSVVEGISGLNGSHTVDFSTMLNGTTFLGFHYGNGQGGPGNATAFYRLDAGTNLDVITLFYNASSNARLYSTSPAIPEPETYALMLGGLGVVAFIARRRRTA